jgi:hypothetical protein
MRPLWRNALWLAFAAGCGAAGFWYGMGWGVEISSNLYSGHAANQALANARESMVALAAADDDASQRYAESNLHSALYELGGAAPQIEGWWTCYDRNRQTLAAASAYLAKHPLVASLDPTREPWIRDGLKACGPSANQPIPPIADGEYRFQIRDPEFPAMAPVPARA